MFLFEGTPNDTSASTLRQQWYRVVDTGWDYDQWILGFQYFGGLSEWKTKLGIFPSLSPVDMAADPAWAIAADGNLMVDGYWGGGRPAAFGMTPAHSDKATGLPDGGNVGFFDGSARWYAFDQMRQIHSWSPVSRECYWFQRDLGGYGGKLGGR